MKRHERLKILRMLSGLTQEGLAKLSGSPRGSISIWERGDHSPSHDAVLSLARSFGCHPGYMMYGSPPLEAAVWIPAAPAARHMPMFVKEIKTLFPLLCSENGFNACADYRSENAGLLLFLGQKDKRLNCMLLADPEIAGCFSKTVEGLECSKIEVPISYGLKNKKVQDLNEDEISLIAQYARLDIDIKAIYHAWFQRKELHGSTDSNSNALQAAFLAFAPTLHEYDVPRPDLWLAIALLFQNMYKTLSKLPNRSFTNDGDLKEDVIKRLEALGCRKRPEGQG